MDRVRILGAGLSGLSAAINLAIEGYDVHVYERNKDVGQRFFGDLQGLENWSEKEDILHEFKQMNIDINFKTHPFNKMSALNSNKISKINTIRPLFYLVKRGNMPESMDLGLKQQAIDAGVNFHFNTTSIEKPDIIATGPISKNVVGVVKGITFKTDLEDTAAVLFGDEAAYRGYAYLLVTNGYGCMSTVLLDNLERVNPCFKRTKEIFSSIYNFHIDDSKRCGGVGCFTIDGILQKDGSLITGEAAGLQDLFLGFGMRYAISSGYYAAQCIINGGDYEEMVRSKYKNKLKAGIVNRYLFEKASRNDYSLIVNNFSWIVKNFSSIYNYNLIQKLLYPLALNHMKNRYNWLN